jgi:hypothetical protein
MKQHAITACIALAIFVADTKRRGTQRIHRQRGDCGTNNYQNGKNII